MGHSGSEAEPIDAGEKLKMYKDQNIVTMDALAEYDMTDTNSFRIECHHSNPLAGSPRRVRPVPEEENELDNEPITFDR